jgi:hypothetical protein
LNGAIQRLEIDVLVEWYDVRKTSTSEEKKSEMKKYAKRYYP